MVVGASAAASVAFALLGWLPWAPLALMVCSTAVLAPAGRVASDDERVPDDVAWWVPVGAVALLFAMTTTATLAGFIRLDLWSTPTRAALSWIALTGALAAAGLWRGGRVRLASPAGAVTWIVPGAMLATGVVLGARPFAVAVRFVAFATDPTTHAAFVRKMWAEGYLRYSTHTSALNGTDGSYPRGPHSLAAWVMGLIHQTGALDNVVTSLSVIAGVLWGSYILLVLASGQLAYLAVTRLDAGPAAAAVACMLAGLLLLTDATALPTVFSGYWPTVLIGWYSVMLLVLSARAWGSPRSVVAVSVLAALTAQTWGLVAPLFAVAVIAALWSWWRQGRQRVGLVVGGLAASVLVGSVPMASLVVGGSGRHQLSETGGVGPVRVWLMVLGVAALAVAAAAGRRRGFRGWWNAWTWWVTAFLVWTAATATALRVGFTTTLPYYPMKVAWNALLLVLPAVAAASVFLVRTAWRSAPLRVLDHLPAGRFVAGAVPVVVLGAVLAGRMSGAPVTWVRAAVGWTLPPPVYVAAAVPALAAADHPQHAVIWDVAPHGLDFGTDLLANRLVLSAGIRVPNSTVARGTIHNPIDVCAFLRAFPDAVRVTGPNTKWGPTELIRDGCPGSVVNSRPWVVVETPKSWWAGTRWADVGGAATDDVTFDQWLVENDPNTKKLQSPSPQP